MPPVAIEMNENITIARASETKKYAVASQSTDRSIIEQEVRKYFSDVPIMVSVARCESEFRQTDPYTGEVFRGHMNPADLGVMQINEYYHGDTADRLGLNLHDLRDNLEFARHLYNEQGTQPWSASRPCWGNDLLAMR